METPPTYGLPFQSLVIDEPRPTADALMRLDTMMARKLVAHGFVTVERRGGVDVLLLYGGAIHSAARLENAQVSPLEVVELFRHASASDAGRMRMCRTDAGLLLLMAVAFQNSPVVKASASVADLERVLADVAARKTAAVVQLLRGRNRTFTYCRDGEPVAVYFGNRADAPRDATTPREQLLAYGYQAPAATSVELYYDLHSRRDEHFMRSFEELLAGKVGPPAFLLTVLRGSERVQRRLLKGGRAEVGRDPASDIAIDHLSVSRHHCTIEWRGSAFWLRDSGSVNGSKINGRRIDGEQQLVHGDRIAVGDFEILFGSGTDASSEQELHTVFLEPELGDARAQVLLDGEPIAIEGVVFKIGRSRDAHLRLGGLFMRPIQATIVREAPGAYRLVPVAGGRAVRVGGHKVLAAGLLLESGTAIRVGGHEIVFVLTDG